MPPGNSGRSRRRREENRCRSDRRPPESPDNGGWEDRNIDDSGSESQEIESGPEDTDNTSLSRILIRRGASLDDYSQLSVEHSVVSRVARGRGRGEMVTSEVSLSAEDGEWSVCRFDDGKLQLESGYVMQFVEEDLVELPIYDIISIPDSPSYPVPEPTIESLPGWAMTKLDRQGHLKITGEYDRTTKELRSVRLGWEDRPKNMADMLAEVLQEYDGDRLARSVYYYLHKYASEEYSDPESIAELRDIQESSVKSEIREAERQLPLD